jgi:hypothetical protein
VVIVECEVAACEQVSRARLLLVALRRIELAAFVAQDAAESLDVGVDASGELDRLERKPPELIADQIRGQLPRH